MIRKYRDKDFEAIIEIWFDASQIAIPFLSNEFLAEERDNIQKINLPKAEAWVFETEDRVAGFIALIGNEVGAILSIRNCRAEVSAGPLADAASLHAER